LQSGLPQFDSLFRFTVQSADDVDPCLEFELTLLHRFVAGMVVAIGKEQKRESTSISAIAPTTKVHTASFLVTPSHLQLKFL
jgi:hypothetical protein